MVTKKTTTKKAAVKKTPTKKAAKKKVVKKVAKPEEGSIVVSVVDEKGKELRTINVPTTLFGASKNDSLVYQVVTAMEANARTPIAHTKTRGEVRGGGKKPWKQKGTGRARHGSRRSPIWKGGGVTFGPRNDKDYSQKINKKMRARALAVVLSQKLADGKVLFVDTKVFTEPKTKTAKAFLESVSSAKGFEALATRRNNAALVALGAPDMAAKKSFSNMGNVLVEESRNLNPADILQYKFVVILNPEATVETLIKRMK